MFNIFRRKQKCNHIIGIRQGFGEEEVIYHDEFMKKKKLRGQIFWKCPLCHKLIWIWVDKNDRDLGHIKIRKYIGYKV